MTTRRRPSSGTAASISASPRRRRRASWCRWSATARRASLWDCAAEVQRLAEAAREGRATRAELTGSTITITSLGALGGIVTTPVINRPEVAIIGPNKQVVRPVWQGAAVRAAHHDEPVVVLRSPRHRRLRRRALRAAHQGPARSAGDDFHRGVRWPKSLPRFWSWAAGPAAMSAPSGPASSASMSCWSSRAASMAGWAAPASMSAASRRRR